MTVHLKNGNKYFQMKYLFAIVTESNSRRIKKSHRLPTRCTCLPFMTHPSEKLIFKNDTGISCHFIWTAMHY